MVETVAPLPSLNHPRTATTARGVVGYLDLGEGPVAFALHGAMGGYDQSAVLGLLAFGSGYRIIAPSRPGFPGTPTPAPAGPKEQAERMVALLDALEIPSCIVIAISGGGPCAIHMALLHPERCRALILASTVSQPNPVEIPKRFAVLKAMAYIPGLARLMKTLTARKLASKLERSFPDPALRQRILGDPETRELYFAMTLGMFAHLPARLRASENDFRITAATHFPLEEIRVPTLIVHADDDPYVPYAQHALHAQAGIPNAQLLTLPAGGHAAVFTHRRELRAGVRAFLNRPAIHSPHHHPTSEVP